MNIWNDTEAQKFFSFERRKAKDLYLGEKLFLSKILFYYRQHHKYSNHQPTYDYQYQITAFTCSIKLSSTHLLMHLITFDDVILQLQHPPTSPG